LNNLTDVVVSDPIEGQVLAFNGGIGANRWENQSFTLEDLANISLVAPVTGQVLMYNAALAEPRWQNSQAILLDFIQLTTADDVLRIRVDKSGKVASAGFSLDDIPNGFNRTIKLPNADGTLALQDQFTITQAFSNPAVSAPPGVRVDAFADCPAGKAIGVGIASTLPVQVEDMLITDVDTVRITVRGIDANTTVQAIAFCMTMP
jgi:hypothetical protein